MRVAIKTDDLHKINMAKMKSEFGLELATNPVLKFNSESENPEAKWEEHIFSFDYKMERELKEYLRAMEVTPTIFPG